MAEGKGRGMEANRLGEGSESEGVLGGEGC